MSGPARSNARAPAPFQIYEDPPPPPPISFFFPTLPSVRAELVSAIQEANPVINSPLPSRVLQANRWSPPDPITRTWSLESGARQMHYAYETRSWHRVSSSIARSESVRVLNRGENEITDTPEEEARAGVAEQQEAQTVNSLGMDAVVEEPQPRQRKRDRFRRFSRSIVQKVKDLRKDPKDPEDPSSRGRLRRAFTLFQVRRRGQ
ncbi:hypothetical protein Q9L58_006929 [Maublancomyces gigas]|uniref:Uncharacterized protein n=1 Tax=Discina gigas TaxID=1032678 RepID=A0ABR3GEI0_9PEZI